MDKIVYLDNAATTRISKKAIDAMMPYLTLDFGNASSLYSLGQKSKVALENSRKTVADVLGSRPDEVYFTGSGTESINWALKSAVKLNREKGKHIISSKIEHPAVKNTLEYLGRNGYDITYLESDTHGQISLDELSSSIRNDTVLISIMTANNEVGTILPIAEIGKIARKREVLFHTDAVQAVGHIPTDVNELSVDLLSFSGHKLGGLKGVGVLYAKKGLQLEPLIHGGGHERGKRSGTENIPGIVSLAAALEDAVSHMPLARVKNLRNRLIDGVLEIPGSHLTGDPVNRLPGIASFVFEGIEGESLLLLLNQHGICASSGSACSSDSLDPSHVLLALGLSHETAHGSLRLSLSVDNTDEDIDFTLDKLPGIVEKLRMMSPLWKG